MTITTDQVGRYERKVRSMRCMAGRARSIKCVVRGARRLVSQTVVLLRKPDGQTFRITRQVTMMGGAR